MNNLQIDATGDSMDSPGHRRVLDALELREPDRVPTFDLMLEPGVVGAILGKKPSVSDRLLSPRNPAAPIINRYMELLGRSRALHERVNSWLIEDYNLKLALDGAKAAVEMGYDSAWTPYNPIMRPLNTRQMTDIHGRLLDVTVTEAGFQEPPAYREGMIKSEADWIAWDKRPLLALPAKGNAAYSKVVAEYGSKIFLIGFVTYGIFENTWQAMGFEEFVVASRRQKRFVTRMIKFYEDLHCMLIEALADAGVGAYFYTDDLAFKSGPMINPRVLEELFGDSYRRLAGTAHSAGIKIIIHSCGNVLPLLNWFADCGFDAVQSLEPTAGVTLAEAKRVVGDRLCLIGNIDVSKVLVSGTREEVFEAVRQAIREAGPGGGYILSPEHNHAGVSVQRLRWMLEAVREYGAYPLSA